MYAKYAKLRDTAGITDYRVAQETGISTSTLTNWKKGRYTPKVDKLSKIATYFGVSIEDLVNDDPMMNRNRRRSHE